MLSVILSLLLLIAVLGDVNASHINIIGASGSARIPLSEDLRENFGWTEEVVAKCLKQHDPEMPPVRFVLFTQAESENSQKGGVNVFSPNPPHPKLEPSYVNITAKHLVQNLNTSFEKQIVRKVICNNPRNRTASIKCSDKVKLTHLEYLTTKPSHEFADGVETWIDADVANSEKQYGFVFGQEETQGSDVRAPSKKYVTWVRPGYAFAIVTWKILVYARFDVEYEYSVGGVMCVVLQERYKDKLAYFWPVSMLQNCTENIRLSQKVEIGKVISYGTETIKVDNSQVTELAGVRFQDVDLVSRIPTPCTNEN